MHRSDDGLKVGQN